MIGYRIFGLLGWALIFWAVGLNPIRLAIAHGGIFLLFIGYGWYKTTKILNEK